MSDTDRELLDRYVRHQAEDAFTEIVRRHLDLVHSAALRQVRSPHLAEEVAQSAFLKLARHAASLSPDTIIPAWLYQVTRREAIDVVRREASRQRREQAALALNAMNASPDDWSHIEPLLDEAMDALPEADRAAVLLRYFENRSLREVGQALGTSDDTAQKRVSRAVEKLRDFFATRGLTVGASGLAAVLSANAAQAAPAGLAATISQSSVLPAIVPLTHSTHPITQVLAMSTLKKSLVVVVVLLLGGGTIHWVTKRGGAGASNNAEVAVNLRQYTGHFEMPGHKIELQPKSNGLAAIIDGQPAFTAYARSETEFSSHDHNSLTELTFVRNGAGKVTQFALVRDGKKLGDLTRVNP